MDSHLLRIGRHATAGIIWLEQEDISNFMSSLVGREFITTVGGIDEKACCRCTKHLSEIRIEETWYCFDDEFYCELCYETEKATLLERLYTRDDRKKVMPRLINNVKSEIRAHRHFDTLDRLEQMQCEECLNDTAKKIARGREVNAYLRSTWSHLYHGTPLANYQ